MKWSLLELNKQLDNAIPFTVELDLAASLKERNSEVLSATPVLVTGEIKASQAFYELTYSLQTELTLPSSRSLEPVPYECRIDVAERFVTKAQYDAYLGEDKEEELFLLEAETIDLIESVEDNILVSLPFQIFTASELEADSLPAGNDWQIISETDYWQQKEERPIEMDPRLAKLSTLLDNDKDSDSE